MILEIVTPEATLLNTEVDSVIVPGMNGEFEMLNNHAPIVSLLVEGTIKFKGGNVKIKEEFASKFNSDKGRYSLSINSGTLEMKKDKVIILAD